MAALERVKRDGNAAAKAKAEDALGKVRTPEETEESVKAHTAVLWTTKEERVREEACRAIANIATDSALGCPACVRAGAPAAIVGVLKATNDDEVMFRGSDALETLAWSDSESRPVFVFLPSITFLTTPSSFLLLLFPSFLLASLISQSPPSSSSANHKQACRDAGAVAALERVKRDGNVVAKAKAKEALLRMQG